MKEIKKSITYITATCKAAENRLLGKERIRRMAEAASEKDALAVLKETSFGGGTDGADSDSVIKKEEKLTLDFVREYAPDESCLSYFLLPYDFYNAEAIVKCVFSGNSADKYVGEEGFFTVDELKTVAESLFKAGKDAEKIDGISNKMPAELIGAMKEAFAALDGGGNGVVTGVIFKRAEYACLLRVVKHSYLKKMLVSKLDAINVSVCLRTADYESAEKQLINGGTLTEAQKCALCEKDEKKVAETFASHPLKETILRSVKAIKDFKPLVDLEKEINGGGASRMYDGRFTEQSGTLPFVAYVSRRLYETACVRIVLSGKTNGLDGEKIAERLKTL